MAKNTSGMNRKYQDKTFDSQDWQLVNKKTGETKDQKGVIYMERTLTDKVTFNSKS